MKVKWGCRDVAMGYEAQGRYAEAEPLLQRALAITEKAVGPDHPDVAVRLNGLAMVYYAQRRHSEAEPLFQRALVIAEKALGPEHPDVGTRLNNLAVFYDAQGRYAESEPLYRRALVIGEKALAPTIPTSAQGSTIWQCSTTSNATGPGPSTTGGAARR